MGPYPDDGSAVDKAKWVVHRGAAEMLLFIITVFVAAVVQLKRLFGAFLSELPSGLEDREDRPLTRNEAAALLEGGVMHKPVPQSEVADES